MSRRSRAREVALQVLFQDDLNSGVNPAEADAFLLRRLGGMTTASPPPFAQPVPYSPPKSSSVSKSPVSKSSEATGISRASPFGTVESADPSTGATSTGATTASASALIAFARSLVAGVRRNRSELDELLGKTADNWRIERMAVTDRNVLRLGAFELIYTDVPSAVAINEAVELAKRYGSAQSAQFVNGILDKLQTRK